jgi:pinin
MAQVIDPNVQRQLEQELRELEKQRLDVEQRLKELESKERFESGGRQIGRGNKRGCDDSHEPRGRPDISRDFRSRPDSFPNKRRLTSSFGINNNNNNFSIDLKTPKITSTVVKVAAEKPSERPAVSSDLNNEEIKKRNRKMFGVLLGTLQQFKKETEEKSELDQKRMEIDQKVQSKVDQERNELLERHKRIIAEQKERELALAEEIRKKQEEKETALLEHTWSQHRALLARFHKTRAKPPVYFAFNPKAPPMELPKYEEEPPKEKPKEDEKARDSESDEESTSRRGDTERRKRVDKDSSSSSESESESDGEKEEEGGKGRDGEGEPGVDASSTKSDKDEGGSDKEQDTKNDDRGDKMDDA